MTKKEQIAEMAHSIYNNELVDISCYEADKIAEMFIEQGYQKIDKDSVVLSKKEYEMRITQYKNLEIKYSNLSDNYKLCKDANETIKQFAVIARKEAVKEFAEKVKEKAYIDNYFQEVVLKNKIDELLKEYEK